MGRGSEQLSQVIKWGKESSEREWKKGRKAVGLATNKEIAGRLDTVKAMPRISPTWVFKIRGIQSDDPGEVGSMDDWSTY